MYHTLKAFWSEELNDLKHKSIFWHDIWLSSGRLDSGWLYQFKTSCKYKYKLGIKQAYLNYESKFSDEFCSHFLNKDLPQFWRSWNKQFRKNITKQIHLNGHSDDSEIANIFAANFEKVFTMNNYVPDFSFIDDVVSENSSSECSDILFSVDLIDKCINDLKKGKACGPDDISAEHLQNAHPSLVILLKLLFGMMVSHGFVPNDFGNGIIIPLIKDKAGDINDSNNYRGITLTPVISKVFESLILESFPNVFKTDDRQFGFKPGLGCDEAIFSCKFVTDHFISKGSSVYASALDISKAFDKIDHGKLFLSLSDAGLPSLILKILINWYEKLFVCVRWNGYLSSSFRVNCGVRQGGKLSPYAFNCFINLMITKLKSNNIGCSIGSIYLGCFFYADDIILLSASVRGLQNMLDTVFETSCLLSLKFNCGKSHCIAFGPSLNLKFAKLMLGNELID